MMGAVRFAFGLLFLAVFLWGCGSAAHYEKSLLVMDTVVSLSAFGDGGREAVEESEAWLREFDVLVSPRGEGSQVACLADMAGKGYVQLHPEVYRMLELSQEYSRRTEGAWDVTAGPLTELWGIGTDRARIPLPEEIAAARKLVGWQHLLLRPEDGSAMLELPGMSLSLGGIAKGFAVDRVRQIYEKHGVRSGLINMGASSMYALGQKENHSWNIGLRHPRKEGDGVYLAVIPLKDQALSTSGDYERFLERDGKRYPHIMDPATGCPADSGVMSVTVVVDGSIPEAGTLSDLLTTAVFVLGPEKGKALLDSLPEEIRGCILGSDYGIRSSHGFLEETEGVGEDFHPAP